MKTTIAVFTLVLLFTSVGAAQTLTKLNEVSLGGPVTEEFTDLVHSPDGGITFVGHRYRQVSGTWDLLMVKTDEDGVQLWEKTYGGSNDETSPTVCAMADGYALFAVTNSYGAGSTDFYFIRTDLNGDTLWTRTYGTENSEGANLDAPHGLANLDDGGFIMCGYCWTGAYAAEKLDAYVVRIDQNGDEIWNKRIGEEGSLDVVYKIFPQADGGFVMSGTSMSWGADGKEIWLYKMDADGDSVWSKLFGASDDLYALNAIQARNGDFILAGRKGGADASADVLVARANESGDSLWMHTYGGDAYEHGAGIVEFDNGHIAISGRSDSYGGGDANGWLFVVDEDGNQLCDKVFGGSGSDQFISMTEKETDDPDTYELYVSGHYGGTSVDGWFVDVQYDPGETSIHPYAGAAVPSAFTLTPPYPNPFNPSTSFMVSLPRAGDLTVALFDVLGRQVATAAKGHFIAGNHRFTFNGSGLTNGVYFIRASMPGEGEQVRKVVLMK